MNNAINNNNPQNIYKSWLIVLIGGLFYMYQYLLRVSPNIMNDELLASLSIDAITLGSIISVYYWAYASLQLPVGTTIDKIGPRKFLTVASFLCAISCFIFGNTHSAIIAGFARFLMGMGSSCGLIGTIKLGTIWLPPKHIAKVTGLAILLGTIGPILGGSPLRYVLKKIGLAHTMELLGIIGCTIGILIFFTTSSKSIIKHKENLETHSNESPLKNIQLLARTPQAWTIASYGLLTYVPVTIMGNWGVSFIERACKTTEIIAASTYSTIFVGAALGSLAISFFSDHIKSRRIPMIIGSCITSIIWSIIIFIHNIDLTIIAILFFIAGFAYTTKSLTFASICETVPSNISGTAIAFINMIVMSAGTIVHPLVGFLIKKHWSNNTNAVLNGIPYYHENDFRFALIIIPCVLVLSIIVAFFIKESHPESSAREFENLIDNDVL